jgi:hypothetical protein
MGVIEDLNRAASEDPLLLESNVYVFLASQWPLPWLLAPFKNSFYFTGTPPEMNSPAVVFSDVVRRVEVEGQLDGIFYFTQFKLRPAMGEVIVYFSEEVFKNIPKDKSKTVYQKWEPTRSHQ